MEFWHWYLPSVVIWVGVVSAVVIRRRRADRRWSDDARRACTGWD